MMMVVAISFKYDEENEDDENVNDDDGDVDVIDDKKKGLALELLLIAFATDGFFWKRNRTDNWKFGGNTFVGLFGELNKVIIPKSFQQKEFCHSSHWKEDKLWKKDPNVKR